MKGAGSTGGLHRCASTVLTLVLFLQVTAGSFTRKLVATAVDKHFSGVRRIGDCSDISPGSSLAERVPTFCREVVEELMTTDQLPQIDQMVLISRKCPGNFLEISGKCPGHFLEFSWTFP